MSSDALLTLGIIAVVLFALVRNLAPADVVFLGATSFLAACGVITPTEAFAGFANEGVLTVAVLFVVAASLRDTGVLDTVGYYLLRKTKSKTGVLGRLSIIVLSSSAFLNNTPIVAMFMPIVLDWCRRHRVSPSQLLIPLSYLAILGGTCTLIGTSTNLVVNGLMIENGLPGMSLFELSWVGVPCAVVGALYLIFFSDRLLPERKDLISQLSDSRREYLLEMQVLSDCRLVGQTVEAGGLRHLPGMFLIEIDRGDQIIAPVGPDDVIRANDRLVFTGIVSSIIELEQIPGLIPLADPTYEVSPKQKRNRSLYEAVISGISPLNGKTIRSANFRSTYGAAVVAVHRSGSRIKKKIGDIALQPGDTLLLQTNPSFLKKHRDDPAFFLISRVDEWRPLRRDRAWVSIALFTTLLVLMTTGVMSTAIAGLLVAVASVGFGCISVAEARRSVEWEVLVTIAAAFGVGTAMQNSGAATALSELVVNATAPFGLMAALASIYIIGSLLTSLITNNAAAILMFPICLETAQLFQVDSRPFLIVSIMSASACFMTPIGYQTNMMVYGPGGYQFVDFLRIGVPMNIVLGAMVVIITPLVWPF
jgi:di/tricarboxylate transporter